MCGPFTLAGSAEASDMVKQASTLQRALLSHAIRKMQHDNEVPKLTSYTIEHILQNTALPKPFDQADNLIQWLGDHLEAAGNYKRIGDIPHRAIIGAASSDNYSFVVRNLVNEGLLSEKTQPTTDPSPTTLTFKGWKRYYELQRGRSESRTAFMAMKFHDRELDNVFREIFRPAVRATGFELMLLTDRPKAGLIDDRLRVEIRKALFLIADLSHANPGAYWEAGYAEGLGKPVIYTCKKEVFDDESRKPHFDTNHHLTIIWDSGNLDKAAEDLKATIRATLPDEAKLRD